LKTPGSLPVGAIRLDNPSCCVRSVCTAPHRGTAVTAPLLGAREGRLMSSTSTSKGRAMTETVSGGAHGITEVLAHHPQTSRQSAYLAASPRPIQHSAAARPVDQLKSSLRRLANELIDGGAKAASGAVDSLSGKLEGIASRGGSLTGAAAGGLKAVAVGRNPVWGAVKGAIGGLSTTTKVLIVLALVLALLLGPVVLVVLLLGLLVLAIVVAVRSRRPT
jgi:hypothetical protein